MPFFVVSSQHKNLPRIHDGFPLQCASDGTHRIFGLLIAFSDQQEIRREAADSASTAGSTAIVNPDETCVDTP